MAALNTDHKNGHYNRGSTIIRQNSFNEDVCLELETLGYGSMNECITASSECLNFNDINDVRDELTKYEHIVESNTDDNEHSPSPPLYRNRAYLPYHIYTDIPPPSQPYPTPNIVIREWIYSEDEATPAPPTPNNADHIDRYRNERKDSDAIIKKSNTDSESKLYTLCVPPFFKLMNSLSSEYNHDDDEMKDRSDDSDDVQLYEVIRDITDMKNHNDFRKNALLLTHHLVTNSNTILKCVEQRVFRDDHDSESRISTTSNGSGHRCSPSIPSITTTSTTSTSSHQRSIPSFTSFSTFTELISNSHSRSRSNESACFQYKAPILSSFLVQTKVIEFIRFWMVEYWKEDWQNNAKLRARCKLFIQRYKEHEKINLTPKEIEKSQIMIHLLENTMNKQRHNQLSKASEIFGDKIDFNTPLSPAAAATPTLRVQAYNNANSNSKILCKSKDILDLDSKSVAEQLTLIMFNIFKKIKARECLDQNWKKEDKYICAPNISRYIDTFNKITVWIQRTILFAKSAKHRSQTIKHWLKIQETFYNVSNFMGVSAIGCALTSTIIWKLKDAWHLVQKKHSKQLKKHEAIQMIMMRHENWSKLRELQSNKRIAIIPFFPMFATDMIAIELVNKKRVKNGSINFNTLCKIHDTIDLHLSHQKRAFSNIKSDATLQRWINKQLCCADEDTEQQLFDACKCVIAKDQNELGNKSIMQ